MYCLFLNNAFASMNLNFVKNQSIDQFNMDLTPTPMPFIALDLD